ncbi:MAG: hypothetical protein QNJ11_08380 [Woeseiaceae bacterium]|nr:hypothetical protein [Woeseiaceae bacterium]
MAARIRVLANPRVLTLLASLWLTQALAGPSPLFSDDWIVDVTIEAPLTTLMAERPDEEYLAARLIYDTSDDATVELDLKIRTRGQYRRDPDHCDFAPLRLNFRKGQVPGTLFDGQDKLKLVTHCRSKSTHFQQHVLREYLAYRFFAELTPISFGVRLLNITYIDTESGATVTRPGFLIESAGHVARRNNLQVVDIRRIGYDQLDPKRQNLVHMFEYMIGNTEYSFVNPKPGKSCCHNADVLSATGGPPYLPLPFDFDFAGLVNAPYAQPNPRFPIDDVRKRFYKGLCANNALLPETAQRFLAEHGDMITIVDRLEPLSRRSRLSVRNYLNTFVDRISDERSLERYFANKCLEPGELYRTQ